MDFVNNSGLNPASQAANQCLFDNSTVRALNAANQMGTYFGQSELQSLNSACSVLNSSPTEFITGFGGSLPNLDFGITNPGFNKNMILNSLKEIPILQEVIDFKRMETQNIALKAGQEQMVFSNFETQCLQKNNSGMKKNASEAVSTTQSCSLNNSSHESSHPICDSNKLGRFDSLNANNAMNTPPAFFEQNMNFSGETGPVAQSSGSYQPLIIPEGSNVIIPQGYIQVQTETKSCSRKTKVVTECEHKDRKHYAKGLCSSCYHKGGRTKKAWNCEHKDRIHYAKGCCQDCYISFHSKRGKKKLRKVIEEEVNDIANVIRGDAKTSMEFAF